MPIKKVQKPERDWMTVTEAAEHLQITKMTLYQWIHRGKLKTTQVVPKGKHFISRESIKALTSACAHHERTFDDTRRTD